MAGGVHPLVEILIQVCVELGVVDFVISPGSRSAPLTAAAGQHPLAVKTHVVYDERAAAYFALGLAQQKQRPVGVICTSGTAAVNFGPAVVEAYYQGIPLLVLTADRPPEWIDQQDNQAIHQSGLFSAHVRGAYALPAETGFADAEWYVARITAEAIAIAQGLAPGPVHINVPLREPLYSPPALTPDFTHPVRISRTHPASLQLDAENWADLAATWNQAERKLIIAGMHAADPHLRAAITALAADPAVAVFSDITANLHGIPGVTSQADLALASTDAATLDALRPDLVVHFGGQVTSKSVKQLLRRHRPPQLWHIRPSLPAPDTYQALTDVIQMHPWPFLQRLAESAVPNPHCDYAQKWQTITHTAATALETLLDEAPFGEFHAVRQVLCTLPADSYLQIGNSMPIRYANFAGLRPAHLPAQVNSNRGASGIDGAVSTAVGAAVATGAFTTLIVGDLGFFYDRNGLWQRSLPPDLHIVLLEQSWRRHFRPHRRPGSPGPTAPRTIFPDTPDP
ncbi:MAG: 2-succinyl-5-enolpyruvyl-6-hydroxy-3-cyclohexene-1-carboxylic-acid synthase [Anaerolineales bacterium]|nr:2-succinyl-5-enolpyruvyl-6-hydroxy-3-cyclohexene-1-carboxylic-acid synthase [Anaerolineales bacterium]